MRICSFGLPPPVDAARLTKVFSHVVDVVGAALAIRLFQSMAGAAGTVLDFDDTLLDFTSGADAAA